MWVPAGPPSTQPMPTLSGTPPPVPEEEALVDDAATTSTTALPPAPAASLFLQRVPPPATLFTPGVGGFPLPALPRVQPQGCQVVYGKPGLAAEARQGESEVAELVEVEWDVKVEVAEVEEGGPGSVNISAGTAVGPPSVFTGDCGGCLGLGQGSFKPSLHGCSMASAWIHV